MHFLIVVTCLDSNLAVTAPQRTLSALRKFDKHPKLRFSAVVQNKNFAKGPFLIKQMLCTWDFSGYCLSVATMKNLEMLGSR